MANNTVTVQDYKNKKDNFAVRNANGTGPYRLVSREQDVKTVLRRNEDYWGKGQFALGVEEISYLTVKADATRVAALLSGDVDQVQDVPTQDIDRLQKTPGIRVNIGPENRTIFLGMDVGSPELKTSDVKGRNPFADWRVRQAMNTAIDREAIKRAVMRNQAVPDHHAAVRQWLHEGARRHSDGRPAGGAIAARRGRVSRRLLRDAALPERSLCQ